MVLTAYGKPPPAEPDTRTREDKLVTMLSVIGDLTYPDGCNMDEPAPGEHVPRRIFVRELVQQAKALLGAY
jgi:hypothetical protein